jgi:AcrR family transcriptional regulator
MVSAPRPRRYDSSRRQAQAASNRRHILEAARVRFLADGYGGTTMAAIAAAAEVSTPTVYAAFGSKAELLRRVIEVAVAGDDEAVAVEDRPVTAWVEAGKTAEMVLARYAVMIGDLNRRAAPVFDVLVRAADTDPELADLAAQFEAQRLSGAELVAGMAVKRGGVPAGRSRAEVRDLVWLYNSPEQYTLLVTKRKWSQARYVAWLTDAFLRVLEPPASADVAPPE